MYLPNVFNNDHDLLGGRKSILKSSGILTSHRVVKIDSILQLLKVKEFQGLVRNDSSDTFIGGGTD